MFTRQHYKAIAEIVKQSTHEFHGLSGEIVPVLSRRFFCDEMANYFAKNNPLFNRQKFLGACGLEKN